MLKRIYISLKSFLASLLFPRVCIGCGKEARWICGECLKTIDIIKQPFCPECRRPTEMGEFCENCASNFALDGIFICANLEEGVLKEAVHQFKYNSIADIGGFLGRIMAGKMGYIYGTSRFKAGALNQQYIGFDYIIPVPLHKKRLKQRGFNQSEILSYELSRINTNNHEWGDMVLKKDILVRKKWTRPQMELGREERLENLKDVFEIVGATGSVAQEEGRATGSPLQGKSILLVDDITTTGATLEECAKVLKQNGARSVWGIVLAKGR